MRLTLRKKLGLGFGVILALTVFSTTMNYVESTDLGKNQDAMVDLRFPAIETARELQRDLNYTQVKGAKPFLREQSRPGGRKLKGRSTEPGATLEKMLPSWTNWRLNGLRPT
ncbi:MAG: hypothetical protein WAU92_03370, partial [Candidatus Sulfotelmatobacter sp.]